MASVLGTTTVSYTHLDVYKRQPKALGRPCVLCHKEHRGLEADLYGWVTMGGQQKFNHDTTTRFPLSGRHSVVDCKDCHKQKTTTGRPSFLLAPMACVGCHKSPHGELHELSLIHI